MGLVGPDGAGPEDLEHARLAVELLVQRELLAPDGVRGPAPVPAYVGSPTQLSNYLALKGSFSAVSKPNFASRYALESSRRDLQNAFSKLNFLFKNRFKKLPIFPNFAKVQKLSKFR